MKREKFTPVTPDTEPTGSAPVSTSEPSVNDEQTTTTSVTKQEPLLSEMTYVEREFYKRYGKTIADASDVAKNIDERMKHYISSMNSSVSLDNQTGATHQNHLFTTIVKAFSQNDDTMFEAVDVLLLHIHSGRGDAFANNMVYRFMSHIGRDHDDILSFQQLLEISLRIANPVTRPAYANDPVIKHAVAVADNRYRDVMYNLVRYLSVYSV